mgnify:CR=1 FL=1
MLQITRKKEKNYKKIQKKYVQKKLYMLKFIHIRIKND